MIMELQILSGFIAIGGLDQALGKLFTTRSPIVIEPLRICSSIIMGHVICLFRKFVTFYHYKKNNKIKYWSQSDSNVVINSSLDMAVW